MEFGTMLRLLLALALLSSPLSAQNKIPKRGPMRGEGWGFVMFAAWAGGILYAISTDMAKAPWDSVGSEAYVNIVNPAHDSVSVLISAPEFKTNQWLTEVPPCDSVLAKLPFADTDVYVYMFTKSSTRSVRLMPNKPKIYRVEFR